MRNIPSNDPGLVLVPGDLQAFCEWLVRRAGGIATCVESAEMMVEHVIKGLPLTPAQDNWLADDLLQRGQASPNGSTDSLAASQQMTRLGVPNVQYGWDWFAANDFVPLVKDSINRGMPVLFGVYAAHNLHDDWTNQPEDAGVNGHGICLFGYDDTGCIVGDPNTAQAQRGDFVHYTWADLRSAGGQYPSMVIPQGRRNTVAVTDSGVGPGFKDYADSHQISAPQIGGGEQFNEPNPGESWAAWDAEPVLTYTPAEGVRDNQAGRVVKFLFEQRGALRGEVASLQAQVQAAQKAQAEAQAADQAAQAALASAQAQVAALQAQLQAAQAQAANPAQVQALKDVLAKVAVLLAPAAEAASEVKAVLG